MPLDSLKAMPGSSESKARRAASWRAADLLSATPVPIWTLLITTLIVKEEVADLREVADDIADEEEGAGGGEGVLGTISLKVGGDHCCFVQYSCRAMTAVLSRGSYGLGWGDVLEANHTHQHV